MNVLRKIVDAVRALRPDLGRLQRSIDSSKMLSARLLVARMREGGALPRLCDAEFQVFSQFGDDGIIQYLVHALGPLEHRFIEFGVQDYAEANTRFLLLNDGWTGLVIDGSAANVARIRRDEEYWRHDLTAVCAFVDAANIDGIFRQHGFIGRIGLLSIDIDGNDYWVWEGIRSVDPAIVVCEYNAVFGATRAVTVPYQPDFARTRAHFSNLYWGASLKALCRLGATKGYSFVGTNSAGNNAYFVRDDRLGPLRQLSSEEGFTASRFRESRDAAGRLTFLSGADRRAAISGLPLVDVETGQTIRVGDLPA